MKTSWIWLGTSFVGLSVLALLMGSVPSDAQQITRPTESKSLSVILLPYEPKATLAARDGEQASAYWGAWAAYGDKLKAAGVLAGGSAMESPANGKTLRGAATTVQNGPYTDSPDQLGGFLLLNVATMEEAVAWAKQCPAATHGGSVEVRPLIPTMAAQNRGKNQQ